VPLLRIRHEENDGKGKKIVVMGRQHPGETVGSYVLEGFLKKIVN
jgi:murein tripeptide amidase MpaA